MSAIDRARASLQALMQDAGTILRPVLVDDGAGGAYPDPSGPLEISVPACAFSRLSGRELELAAQIQQRGSYRLALPITTDIRATDQFVYSNVTYNVVWAPPLTAMSLSRVVGLEEATP